METNLKAKSDAKTMFESLNMLEKTWQHMVFREDQHHFLAGPLGHRQLLQFWQHHWFERPGERLGTAAEPDRTPQNGSQLFLGDLFYLVLLSPAPALRSLFLMKSRLAGGLHGMEELFTSGLLCQFWLKVLSRLHTIMMFESLRTTRLLPMVFHRPHTG